MLKFAVMGDPIAHSKSPEIHQAFAKQFNIALSYERILVAAGKLADALLEFQKAGGYGVNITLPLKEEAFNLVQEKSVAATQAGAINTIIFHNHKMRGENTDGIGLIRDLQNHQISLANKRLLILGAGGAVRGILSVILAEQPAKIIIANRTVIKAKNIIQNYSNPTLEICALDSIPDLTFDLIINATSAGTKGENLQLPKKAVQNSICYDLAYGENSKAFLSWAKANGASLTLNGIGMLVEQAAEAFYLWHGKRPETRSVIATLLNL